MFKSKDGKSFGSSYVAKRRDSEHDKMAQSVMGDSPEHEAAETPEFEKGEQEGMKEAPEQEKPEQVVAKHGPANTVHVTHDRKAKKHHVVSTHADGHVHSSDHGSASEAHSHAAALANSGDQPSAEGAPEAPEADGFQMPKLA